MNLIHVEGLPYKHVMWCSKNKLKHRIIFGANDLFQSFWSNYGAIHFSLLYSFENSIATSFPSLLNFHSGTVRGNKSQFNYTSYTV